MATVRAETFELTHRVLWIAIPPTILIIVAVFLIGHLGPPVDHLARAVVQDGHAEAAARLRVLATWLLLAAASIASIIYCGWSTRVLESVTKGRLRKVYFAMAVIGIMLVALGQIEGGQRLMDRRVICAAFDLVEAPAGVVPPSDTTAVLSTYVHPPAPVSDTPFACASGSRLYQLLWWLNEIQKYLLVLLIPALVIGMLSCLALPPAPEEEDRRYQARRLKIHLYLTAASLVAGLLFLSALLHWPGFAFHGAAATSYKAHVDAYTLYWGVAYSLFIACYYVPVAIGLAGAAATSSAKRSRKEAAHGGADARNDTGSIVAELFGQLKTLLALFAPAIAGLLGGIVQL
ncbi:MAG TPA: hypothetical protein VGO55_02705 [Allosphingosinicella sp.]|jgi:hypothetical protein|nr:hypothetical protein [Allosphingosinicella sp.]